MARVALVTGGTRGIGEAISVGLKEAGFSVAANYGGNDDVANAFKERTGIPVYKWDVGDFEACRAGIEKVEAELGPVDVLVTNSGGPPPGPDPLGFSRDQWEDAYRTLVLGPLALIERTVPGMRERGFGRVVSVSSSAVREPIPVLMLSNAHRSGLLAAFKTLARDAASDGVTFNSVLPGRIATDRAVQAFGGSREAAEEAAREQVPAGRLGTVEEIASVAAFLCSERASYMTGTAVLVDGGLTQSV